MSNRSSGTGNRRHTHAERAQVGRGNAGLDAHNPRGRAAAYRVTDDHPAAIAYHRALGREGWGNRTARGRGYLGFDLLPVPTMHARVS